MWRTPGKWEHGYGLQRKEFVLGPGWRRFHYRGGIEWLGFKRLKAQEKHFRSDRQWGRRFVLCFGWQD